MACLNVDALFASFGMRLFVCVLDLLVSFIRHDECRLPIYRLQKLMTTCLPTYLPTYLPNYLSDDYQEWPALIITCCIADAHEWTNPTRPTEAAIVLHQRGSGLSSDESENI